MNNYCNTNGRKTITPNPKVSNPHSGEIKFKPMANKSKWLKLNTICIYLTETSAALIDLRD